MATTLTAARLLTGLPAGADGGPSEIRPGWVRIEDGRVAALGTGSPPEPPDVALPDGLLAPGLVDAQVNGAFGVDLGTADEAGWRAVATGLPRHGVTAFVPTITTAALGDLAAALARYGDVRPGLTALPEAARTLGMHLEGPFLALSRRGAHPAAYLREPTPETVQALLAAGGGMLCYLTLAPELPGALDAVRTLAAAGVRVAVGHSDATAECVHAAAAAGATLVTHLFNAQSGLYHREPGVVGAALADPRLTCGLIADGAHVAADVIRIAFAAAPGRIMLVSDAVAALGMGPGRYRLGGEEIVVTDDGPPRRRDGTLAGGGGRLDDAIGRAMAAGVGLADAVEAATRVPADAMGRPDLGRIAPGLPADLVWLAPEGGRWLRARATWIAGRLVHDDGGRPSPDAPEGDT